MTLTSITASSKPSPRSSPPHTRVPSWPLHLRASAFPLNIPQVKLLISTSTPSPCSPHTLPHLSSSITSLLVAQAQYICLILDPSLSPSTFHLSAKLHQLHCTTFSEFIKSLLLPPSSKLPTFLAGIYFNSPLSGHPVLVLALLLTNIAQEWCFSSASQTLSPCSKPSNIRTAWRFLKKLKRELAHNPAIPLLGI